MKKFIILFFTFYFLLLTFNFCSADIITTNIKLMSDADRAYARADYNDAIEIYKKIIANKYKSFKLYYNLGNAYFKINQIPSAILFYEKAKLIDPADEDLNFNLTIANKKIVDKIDVMPQIFIKSWYNALLNFLNSDDWAKLTIISFSLCFLLLLLFLLSKSRIFRRISFWLSVSMLFLSIVSIVFAKNQFNEVRKVQEAIVFTPTVNIKSSPDQSSQDIFVIHEGLKVQILDHVSDWLEIRIPNGNKGWLKSSDIEII